MRCKKNLIFSRSIQTDTHTQTDASPLQKVLSHYDDDDSSSFVEVKKREQKCKFGGTGLIIQILIKLFLCFRITFIFFSFLPGIKQKQKLSFAYSYSKSYLFGCHNFGPRTGFRVVGPYCMKPFILTRTDV